MTGGWDDLVATALLGTERRPLPTDAFSELAWEQPGDEDPAAALLDLASAYVPYRRASARPIQRGAAVVDAPAQDLPFAPPAAQSMLARLIEERSRPLVQEWLTVCVAHGLGVEPQLWPGLADLVGTSDPTLHQVYGERGRAFLGMRDDWARILKRSPTPVVQDEPFDWESANAKERADHLAGLTPTEADLPLLEIALADKRTSVAGVAGERLSLLPGSAYSKRMTARALSAVTVVRHRLRSDELVVQIPDHSPELAADGVSVKPPSSYPGGERTWVLYSIVAATPLAVWTEHTGLAPDALLRLTKDAADADLVHAAWRAATLRQSDRAWAEALVSAGDGGTDLVELIPAERRLALARDLLRAGVTNHLKVSHVLMLCPGPWPGDLVTSTLQLVVKSLWTGTWAVDLLSRGYGLDSLPEVEDAVRRGVPATPAAASIERTLADLHANLAAKAAVHRSFAAPTPGEQP